MIDVILWTSARVIDWLDSIGLEDFSYGISERGIHGALIALDEDFDLEAFALALQIPVSNTEVSPVNKYSLVVCLKVRLFRQESF